MPLADDQLKTDAGTEHFVRKLSEVSIAYEAQVILDLMRCPWCWVSSREVQEGTERRKR